VSHQVKLSYVIVSGLRRFIDFSVPEIIGTINASRDEEN